MLNNKRNHFYSLIYILWVLKSKKNECIFEIEMYPLVIYNIWLFRMIDNLISDPMKQIWINLELYFKRYEISNF